MKKLYDYVVVGFVLLLLAACEKEGGTPTITGVEPATLTASKTEVLLDATTPKAVALQLMWNIRELQSYPSQPILSRHGRLSSLT